MSGTPAPTRRDVLRAAGWAGAGALAAALAACTSGRSASPSSTPATTPTTTVTSTVPPQSSPASSVPVSSSGARSSRPTLAVLDDQLHGRLARPGQRGYQPQTLLYNPRFANQSKPQAIANCTSAADVAACVRFAAENAGDDAAALRIRNGGHSYGGWSSGDGLVANLAAMNQVRVDRSAMTATVGAGARLIEVYGALAAQGVSIGSGSCGTVGISGLTLGGGIGLLSRTYGLTCDQVSSAQVVTADGTTRTIDAHHHPDLFWAIRGGGGSFAAVTSWTFRVRPAPSMQTAFYTWEAQHAAEVLAAWQDWTTTAPRELMSAFRIFLSGNDISPGLIAFWNGAGSPASALSTLLNTLPAPRTSSPGTPESYRDAMYGGAGCNTSMSTAQCVSFLLSSGERPATAAASSILTRPLPEKAIESLVSAVRAGVGLSGLTGGGVQFDSLGGAVGDVDTGDTAFPWRSAIADVQYSAVWSNATATQDPSRFESFVANERAALTPYVGGSGYVNYADPSLRDYATDYWGPNLARLKQVRKTYDPHGVFTFPQAVPL